MLGFRDRPKVKLGERGVKLGTRGEWSLGLCRGENSNKVLAQKHSGYGHGMGRGSSLLRSWEAVTKALRSAMGRGPNSTSLVLMLKNRPVLDLCPTVLIMVMSRRRE